MNQFLSLLQLRFLEQAAAQDGINLIERAGSAVVKWVTAHFSKKIRILVIAGRGNNGSDGLAAAVNLIQRGYKVDVLRLFKDNIAINQEWFDKFIEYKKPLTKLPPDLNKFGLIIDAMYGIGLTHELDVETATVIQKINQSESYILALDAPSGLNPFSGRVQGEAVCANTTLTFICDKPGLHTGDGLDTCSIVEVVDLIDVTKYELPEVTSSIKFNLISDIPYHHLLRAKFNTSKGNYGTVAIIGGNKGMHGALYLAGRAALLAGAGKVVIAPLDNDFQLNLTTPELMLQSPKEIIRNLQAYDAVAIGPGLGQDQKAIKVLDRLLTGIEDSKLLVDADALNLIAGDHSLKLKFREVRYKIITPHPGEAARILGVTVNEVQDNRFMSIADLTDKLNSVTILKGAGTLVQAANEIFINLTGNPALANAGQGDTLTGIIVAFLAQGMDLLPASRLGVFIHGLAADRLVHNRHGFNGILASDIATEAANLVNELVYTGVFD